MSLQGPGDRPEALNPADWQATISARAGGRAREVDAWLEHVRGFWTHRLMALGTEVARGSKPKR